MPIVTPSGKKSDAEIFLSEFRKKYFPNRILVVSEEGGELERQAEMIPVIKSKIAQNGKTTAYVCEQGFCKLPTSDPQTFSKQIDTVEKY